MPRNQCPLCFLSEETCICSTIKKQESIVEVIILQHYHEKNKAIGTEKIVRLSLNNSKSFHGYQFNDHLIFQNIAKQKSANHFLLFPLPNAICIEDIQLDLSKKNYLHVLDGTWSQAKKIIKNTDFPDYFIPVTFQNSEVSDYQIRTQPAKHCLSTVESVVKCLETLEKTPNKYLNLLKSFQQMIKKQKTFIPSEHLLNRSRFKGEKQNERNLS